MPELPEVETVKNVLLPIVKNRKILSIDILRPSIVHQDKNEFKNSLQGETFLNITRIGKFLIFHLTNNKVMVSHLRMEGKYFEFEENDENSKYARVVFHLDNNKKLCYDDSRTFGMMYVTSEEEYLQTKDLAKLGPEPFAIHDVSSLMKKVKNKKLPIKSTLLDQSLLTGLGNIYVDETLYASGVHPLTPAYLISKKEWELIIQNACEILKQAIELGGSTIKSYHPGKDIDGNFQTRIKIYGKQGETCPICHSTYRFIKVGGRGTTFCPKCQIKKGAPIDIGLTGKIASGKSTVMNFFKEKGIPTLSSDEVVHTLYEKEEVVSLISKTLKITFTNNKMDFDLLRNHLLIHKEDKKKLEKVIHPLVKKKILEFLKGEAPIKIVEVPLLFESKMDNLFDTIIVIDIDEKRQFELLSQRNNKLAPLLLEINKTNKIDSNKGKATYIINNNGDKKALIKECSNIFNKLQARLD